MVFAQAPEHEIGQFRLSLIATAVGVITGLGAILFRGLIGIIHNVSFLGQLSIIYDANLYTPPRPWGALVIFVPALGALVVTFLVIKFAPEARGSGVSEVMGAIYYREGRIRPVVAAVKSLAAGVAIGTGAAVGREGPIVQIGASLGSTVGQIVSMASWQRVTLVAAGAAAGIATTFNAPIGGVMFSIELLMPEVSVRTFLPVALATGTATFVARLFLGPQPAFQATSADLISSNPTSIYALVFCAMLGVLAGLVATVLIRGLNWFENVFALIRNSYARHATGMLLVGLLFYALRCAFGHYYIEGVGYATIQDVLLGGISAAPLLVLLLVSKLAATLLSLGSGSSGGIFSPSLFLGATLGGAVGAVATAAFPALGLSVPGSPWWVWRQWRAAGQVPP
jgi:CIC family chloride channel protein